MKAGRVWRAWPLLLLVLFAGLWEIRTDLLETGDAAARERHLARGGELVDEVVVARLGHGARAHRPDACAAGRDRRCCRASRLPGRPPAAPGPAPTMVMVWGVV